MYITILAMHSIVTLISCLFKLKSQRQKSDYTLDLILGFLLSLLMSDYSPNTITFIVPSLGRHKRITKAGRFC